MDTQDDGSEGLIVSTVLFVAVALLLAGLIEALPERIQSLFPQSVLVLLCFLVGCVGVLAMHPQGSLSALTASLEVSPEGIQLIFLPPLIFSELFKSNVHVFFNVLGQVLLLAFPGVLIGTGLVALFPVYVLPVSWSWYEALAFAGMLSATDPVAVIAVLHDLGASKRLSAVIGGESILNDGSAIVVVTLFLDLQAGVSYDAAGIVAFIFREVLGSLLLGLLFGLVQIAVFPLLGEHPTPLVALTLAMPYLCFAAALILGMSGVLALVPLGLMANAFGRAVIVGAVAERMEHFWNLAEFIANSVLFAISGLLIADDLLSGAIAGADWGYLLLLYVVLLLVRMVTVAVLFPLLRCSAFGFSMPDAAVTWWGGLRGAVGLTLAISIRSTANVSDEVGSQATFFMAGIVVLSLVINATTCAPLVRAFGLQHEPDHHILGELSRQFKELAMQSLVFAGGSPDAVAAALRHVGGDVGCDTNADSGGSGGGNGNEAATTSASGGLESNGAAVRIAVPRAGTVQEKRRHLLLAQAVTYNQLVDRKLISRMAWYTLVNSIDVELDSRDTELDHWSTVVNSGPCRILLAFFRAGHAGAAEGAVLGAAFEGLGDKPLAPGKGEAVARQDGCCSLARARTRVLIALVEVAYAFLRAHQLSRHAINAFQSDADRLRLERDMVAEESLRACAAPARFLNAVRELRPDALQRLKSSQVLTSVRHELLDRALALGELGLLEHNELRPLIHVADEIGRACAEVRLALHAEAPFEPSGDFEHNADLHPFRPAAPAPAVSAATAAAAAAVTELALDGEADSEACQPALFGEGYARNVEACRLNAARPHWYG